MQTKKILIISFGLIFSFFLSSKFDYTYADSAGCMRQGRAARSASISNGCQTEGLQGILSTYESSMQSCHDSAYAPGTCTSVSDCQTDCAQMYNSVYNAGGHCDGVPGRLTSWRSGYSCATKCQDNCAPAATPGAGVCGPSNGGACAAPPSGASLCSQGTPSAVGGAYSWACYGSNGGATASCSCTYTPGGGGALDLSAGADIEKMYGYHNIGFGDNGFVDCNEDGNGAGGKGVQINGSPTRGGHGSPKGPSRTAVGGAMTCRYRDAEEGGASVNIGSNGRQKTAPTISVSYWDVGGAGIGNTGRGWSPYENGYVKYIWGYQGTDCFGGGTAMPSPGNGGTSSSVTMGAEGEHMLYVCLRDNTGRQKQFTFGPYRWDQTPPNVANIQMSLNSQSPGSNILANKEANNFMIVYDEGARNLLGCGVNPGMADYNITSCAPLPTITYNYENSAANNTYLQFNNIPCLGGGTLCINKSTWDVTKVDNAYGSDGEEGKRIYDANVLNLYDQAGNYSIKSFAWNLFANRPNWPEFGQADISSIRGGPNVAYSNNYTSKVVGDGDTYLAGTLVMRDVYGNKIIPVPEIGRTVQFDMTYGNSTMLNQYNNNGGGGVFFNLEGQAKYTQLDVSSNSTYTQKCNISSSVNCDNISQLTNSSGRGIYRLNLMSYVPTVDGYVLANGSTNIQKLVNTIKDNGTVNRPAGGINNLSHTVFDASNILKFTPLLYSTINGNPLVSEGIGKAFNVSLSENTSGKFNTLSDVAYLIKYNVDTTKISPYITGGNGINVNTTLGADVWKTACLMGKKASTNIAFAGFDCNASNMMGTNIALGTNYFGAGYILNSGQGSVFDGQSVGNISTHLAANYPNGGKVYGFASGIPAAWNSDIFGTSKYTAGVAVQDKVETQSPIKILGVVGSSDFQKKTALVLAGSEGKINKGGSMDKYKLTNVVHQKVAELIRNVTPTQTAFDIWTPGATKSYLSNGFTVYYVKLTAGNNIAINQNLANDKKILLIVDGGNVYINGNIQQTANGALGIVVLSPNTTEGAAGNVYVRADVTNIESFIYADGGVITYDDVGGNKITQESLGVDGLRNQLYVKGLLRVNNTVGGSRGSDSKCPYFVTNCTHAMAQKYDIEYIRRFHLVKGQQINPDSTRSMLYGREPYSGGYLAGKILCQHNPSNIVYCNDQDSGITNILNINSSTADPFGDKNSTDITPTYKDDLGPLILEYDSKVKNFSVPIFNINL